jgi:hypothetical protein
MIPSCRRSVVLLGATVLSAAGAARGQDSVPAAAGGNDALLAYDSTSQRVFYIVDSVAVTTSWNNPLLVAPILKASRDIDPSFRTQILGSGAISPSLAQNVTIPGRTYALWTAPGQGVNVTLNTAPASGVLRTGFTDQFGVAASDFALNPTNIIGATVGRDSANLGRLYVARTIAAVSRGAAGSVDTATLSLGAADALGDIFLRADSFNTLATTTNRVVGDNIARVSTEARSTALNQLLGAGTVNTAQDAAATVFIVNNETTPTNVPSGVLQPGVGPFGLVFDFTNRLRTGQSAATLSNQGSAHLNAGISGQRGNPSFSPLTPAGGNAGTIATLAVPSSGTRVNALDAAGLNFGSAGAPPTVAPGSTRSAVLPTPIVGPGGFTANASGTASFKQYLSQVPFRGGNGLVGVGQNAAGQLVLAATANDPSAGDFVAVATFTGTAATWTVAAYANQPVLSGPSGGSIGTLNTPATTISAPAVDRLGNVYFVATWKPNLSPVATGLFKAAATAGGYQLELLLTTGQTITGANSTRPYTVTSMSLLDSDSLASGAFHHQHLLQEQAGTAQTTDPLSIRAFGGVIVNTVLTYNNGGLNEAYDAVLFLGPTAGASCPADFNQSGQVSVHDIFDFLAGYFAGVPAADFNHSGQVSVQDIFDFLAAYFMPCP